MRRRYLLILLVPLVVLLALGALPSLIGGGETTYVVATESDLEDGEPPGNATEPIPAANLSENRFPYTFDALENGVSEPHEEGRFGFEDAFTHTPSDEFGEYGEFYREGVDDGTVWIEMDGSYYALEITDDPNE